MSGRVWLRRSLFAALAAAALAPAGASARTIQGSYIVTLKGGAPAAAAERAEDRHGAEVEHVYRSALRGYAADMSAAEAAAVAREPGVLDVVPDRTVSASAQALPTGVDRIEADWSPTAAINGRDEPVDVDVAVIDTGIDPHPDLRVAGGVNCSSGSGYDDGNGHGTHVAGTIGALDNDLGVVGVAPGARLWAVRVLDSAGRGSWSSVICGIDWVTANAGAIEVANMSLGGPARESRCNTRTDPLHGAICRSVAAGVTYAVAAGNESDNAARYAPATYDEVITVSALADFNGRSGGGARPTCRRDVDDTFADFSNFGSDVDLIAPGVCILSTWTGGGYATVSGTSMATPHVAGAAALYKAAHPGASPGEVKWGLQEPATWDWFTGTDPDGAPDLLLNAAGF